MDVAPLCARRAAQCRAAGRGARPAAACRAWAAAWFVDFSSDRANRSCRAVDPNSVIWGERLSREDGIQMAQTVEVSQSVSHLFHGPAPRSPLHRLAVRLRHSLKSSCLLQGTARGTGSKPPLIRPPCNHLSSLSLLRAPPPRCARLQARRRTERLPTFSPLAIDRPCIQPFRRHPSFLSPNPLLLYT